MSQKKILIVDAHPHIREMLTGLLTEHSNAFLVKSVPSGEEAMLELRGLDLLISDVRLPGLSGFDLTKRLRRRKQETAVILITGQEADTHQKEVETLNIFRFLTKPLQNQQFLQSVDYALFGEPEEESQPQVSAPQQVTEQVAVELSRKATERLQSLQADTGASGIMLTLPSGQLIFENGHNERFNLPNIAQITSKSLANSLLLAEELDSKSHFTIQYNTTDKLELYSTNIDDRFFLTLFFAVQARRGRIGTIWIFLQRAISDLAALLPQEGAEPQKVMVAKPQRKLESFAPDDSVLPTDEEFMRELQQLEDAIAEIDRQNQKSRAKTEKGKRGRRQKRNYPPAVEPRSRRTRRRWQEKPAGPQEEVILSSKSAYEEAKERYEARMRAEKAAAPPPPDIPDVPEYKGPTAEELKLDTEEVDLSGIDEGKHGDLFSLFDNLESDGLEETADLWDAPTENEETSLSNLDALIQAGLGEETSLPDFTEEATAETAESTNALSFAEAMKQGLLGEDNPLAGSEGETAEAEEETADLFDFDKLLEQEEAEQTAKPSVNGESLSFEEAMKRGLIPGLNSDDN